MKKAIQLALLGVMVCAGAQAQTTTTVRVGATIEGARFSVDGMVYDTTQVFLWPLGTKHTLQFQFSLDPDSLDSLGFQFAESARKRYFFGGWRANAGVVLPNVGDPIQLVVAAPNLTEIIAQVTAEYKVIFQFYNNPPVANATCQNAPGPAPTTGTPYGLVFVDGACFTSTTEIWLIPRTYNFTAYPYPGYVFDGWLVDGARVDPLNLTTYNLTHPVTLWPIFMPAKRVSFRSDPPGLNLVVDHTIVQTPPKKPLEPTNPVNFDPENCSPDFTRIPLGPPANVKPLCIGDYDFLPGSPHQLGAPQSQQDAKGDWWVFAGFSNGLGQNATYITDLNLSHSDLITARFVPGIHATLITKPAGLRLDVDGRVNWPNYNFIWGVGEKHVITAPANQTDAQGRRYVFSSWSNNGTASQEVTIPDDRAGVNLTVTYQILGQVQVTTTVPGIKLTVDGSECTAPCTVDKAAGQTVQVQVPKSVAVSPLARYDFDGFSTGESTTTSTVTLTTEKVVLQANYHSSFLLTAVSDPPGQVNFTYAPTSPDGYFAEGSQISVTAAPKGGYKFRRWDGALTGTLATASLNMGGPSDVIARLDKVPFIPPAGVKNAAGDTQDGTVAPGSIVAIYGENLAETLEVGPVNPLAQTLSNIYVTINDQMLPLLFVSPRQINAQMPSGLADGKYKLQVHQIGFPDIPADVTVRRNSPAFYTVPDDLGTPWALALHEDGTPVTRKSPARRNEMVSVFGNGFGPFDRKVVDGFIVPEDSFYKLLDAVDVRAGDITLSPQFTGAAPGFVGTTVLRLKISDAIPAASTLEMAVTINGVQSNTAQLPVE